MSKKKVEGLIVDAKQMVDAFSVLDNVPSRPGIVSSMAVQMGVDSGGELRLALSAEVSAVARAGVKGDVNGAGKRSMYIDRRLFMPFVLVARDSHSQAPFNIQIEKRRVIVRQGHRKAAFDVLPETGGYGIPAKGAGTILKSEHLIELLQVARSCATADPASPELNCVYLSSSQRGVELYASNQLVMFHAVTSSKDAKLVSDLAFPLWIAEFLSAKGLQDMCIKEKAVELRLSQGVLWQGVSLKAQKSFPHKRVDTLVHEGKFKWPCRFKVRADRLGHVAARFNQYLTCVRRQDWVLSAKGTAGASQILLEVRVPQGVFKEWLSTESPIAADFMLEWPLDVLLPVFDYVSKIKKAVIAVHCGEKTPYFLEAGDISVIVAQKKTA